MKIEVKRSTAALLMLTIVLIFVAYAFGPALGVPPESHTALVGGVSSVCALVLAAAQSLFQKAIAKDTDHDGVSDFLDETPNGEDEGES